MPCRRYTYQDCRKRVREIRPQWEGSTDDGIYMYARYRWGCLSIGSGTTIAEAVRNSDNLLPKHLRDGGLEYASILAAYHLRALDSAKGEILTFHEMAKVSEQNRSRHLTYRRHEVIFYFFAYRAIRPSGFLADRPVRSMNEAQLPQDVVI